MLREGQRTEKGCVPFPLFLSTWRLLTRINTDVKCKALSLSSELKNEMKNIFMPFFVVCLSVYLSACSQESSSESNETNKVHSDTSGEITDANPVVVKQMQQPSDAANLISVLNQAQSAVLTGQNDIITAQLENKWSRIYCSTLLKIQYFKDWYARVAEIRDTGYFKVEIKNETDKLNIWLSEWVEPGTPMFTTISGLRVGEPIRISGTIEQESVRATCISWASMMDLNYPVHFQILTPL